MTTSFSEPRVVVVRADDERADAEVLRTTDLQDRAWVTTETGDWPEPAKQFLAHFDLRPQRIDVRREPMAALPFADLTPRQLESGLLTASAGSTIRLNAPQAVTVPLLDVPPSAVTVAPTPGRAPSPPSSRRSWPGCSTWCPKPLDAGSNTCSTPLVRWSGQQLDGLPEAGAQALPGMASVRGFLRTVTTPEFAGIRFHEIASKTVLNKVPENSAMPFRWTVNPYRGCSHACVYCYARDTHRYLDLDTGTGFDRDVVVKVNAAEALRHDLARPSWRGEHVALGTNTDPYQRAEGRYRLMPGIISALADTGTDFSVLTKGTLLRRDLALLVEASQRVRLGLGVSLAIYDDELQESLEPGTPSVAARLSLVRAVRAAGLPCGVMLAPVIPWLTDSVPALDDALARLADAGATGVTVLALHLRPGAKEWFAQWLKAHHPQLVRRYADLYGRGAYVSPEYREFLADRVEPLLRRHGFAPAGSGTVVRRTSAQEQEGEFPLGAMPERAPETVPARVEQPGLF